MVKMSNRFKSFIQNMLLFAIEVSKQKIAYGFPKN